MALAWSARPRVPLTWRLFCRSASARMATEQWGAPLRPPALTGLGPAPNLEGTHRAGSARSRAVPATLEASGPEGTVSVDWWGPGRAGTLLAQAGKAGALGAGRLAGCQLHLLGRHLCYCNHSRLEVTLQLPQVCGDKAAQGGRVLGKAKCLAPGPPCIHAHPLHPSSHCLFRTPCTSE